MYKRILVPLDGSDTARFGLREAITLAKEQKATLHLVHVIGDFPLTLEMTAETDFEAVHRTLSQYAEEMMRQAKSFATSLGVETETRIREAKGRRVADAIVAEAHEAGCDLIVIGTHGRRGISRLVLGSDAERVLRQSTVPVLLIREPAKQA